MMHEEYCKNHKYCLDYRDECTVCIEAYIAGMREGYELAMKYGHTECSAGLTDKKECSGDCVDICMYTSERTYDEALAAKKQESKR